MTSLEDWHRALNDNKALLYGSICTLKISKALSIVFIHSKVRALLYYQHSKNQDNNNIKTKKQDSTTEASILQSNTAILIVLY